MTKEEKEFKQLLRQTWIANAFERDKAILTVSSGGIGLLITLANAFPSQNWLTLIFTLVALFCLMAAVVSGVFVFSINKKVLTDEIIDNNPSYKWSKIVDYIMVVSFLLGLASISVLTVILTLNSFIDMKDSNDSTNPPKIISVTNSFAGMSEIKPVSSKDNSGEKSLSDLNKIRPKPQASAEDANNTPKEN